MTRGARAIDAGLHLLDRQIVDPEGRMAGKVDDLELTPSEDDDRLIVTAILSGPGALARQLGGRLGRWIESVHQRLHPHEQPGPARIAFGVVKRVNDHVEVTVSHEDLENNRFEEWVEHQIIDRIPGAGHAPE